MANARIDLDGGEGYDRLHGKAPLHMEIVGSGEQGKGLPFLWVGSAHGCIGTTSQHKTFAFLCKAIEQVRPGTKIETPKSKRPNRGPT